MKLKEYLWWLGFLAIVLLVALFVYKSTLFYVFIAIPLGLVFIKSLF